MTEAEAIELMQGYVENGLAAFTIYTSLTFAYLTVAFLAGSRLTKFQVIVVSLMYVVTAGMFIAGTIASLHGYDLIMDKSDTVLETSAFLIAGPWIWLTLGIQILGTLISVYFMYNVRVTHQNR